VSFDARSSGRLKEKAVTGCLMLYTETFMRSIGVGDAV
jgi:hypothetical protein